MGQALVRERFRFSDGFASSPIYAVGVNGDGFVFHDGFASRPVSSIDM